MQAVGAATTLGKPQPIPEIHDAFAHGMSVMLLVSAAICAVAAVLASARMPLRATAAAPKDAR